MKFILLITHLFFSTTLQAEKLKISDEHKNVLNKFINKHIDGQKNLENAYNQHSHLLEIIKRDEERFKAKYKTLSLPKRCSLATEGEKYSDIMVKLNSLITLLKRSKCRDEGKEFLNQIDNSFQAWSSFTSKKESVKVDEYQYQIVSQISNVFNNLGKLGYYIGCKEELKKESALAITSEVIRSLSSVGYLVPNVYGTVTAVAGQGLAGLFDLIRELASIPYDWDDEEDRNSFVALNCGLFEVQNVLDSEGVLYTKTKFHTKEAGQLSSDIVKLKFAIEELTKSRKKYQVDEARQQEDIKREIISKSLNVESYFLFNELARTNELLQGFAQNAKTFEEKGSILEALIYTYKVFYRNIDKAKLTRYANYLKPQVKEEFKNIFQTKNPTKSLILPMYLGDTKKYLTLINSFMDPIKWVLDDLDKQIQELFKGKIVTSYLLKRANILISDLQSFLDKKEARLKLLKNLEEGKNPLDFNDSGNMERVNLVERLNTLETTIKGKIGYKFMTHLIDKMVKNDSNFQRLYKKTSKYFLSPPKQNLELREVCANTGELMKIYVQLDDYVQVGYDYLSVNERLFLQTPTMRRGAGLIQPGREKYLYNNFLSAQKANKILNSKKLNEKTLKIFRNKKEIGHYMIQRALKIPERIKVQNFNNKHCRRY